jgi:hypothetical protein
VDNFNRMLLYAKAKRKAALSELEQLLDVMAADSTMLEGI